ncbi:MAG: DUF1289 domain-containing protein [Alphaproteobacteria bacterium]|nr:DUF1289 domain-containing protein [Alphaproteobacteria bacterium]
MITSPCNRICTIDDNTGWCIGCARTIKEIVEWGPASDARKLAILADLKGRQKQQVRKGK